MIDFDDIRAMNGMKETKKKSDKVEKKEKAVSNEKILEKAAKNGYIDLSEIDDQKEVTKLKSKWTRTCSENDWICMSIFLDKDQQIWVRCNVQPYDGYAAPDWLVDRNSCYQKQVTSRTAAKRLIGQLKRFFSSTQYHDRYSSFNVRY